MKSYGVIINGKGYYVSASSPIVAVRRVLTAEDKRTKGKLAYHEAKGSAIHIYYKETT